MSAKDVETKEFDRIAVNVARMRLNESYARLVETRTAYMSKLGQAYDGNRDTYEALGYPKSLDFNNFKALYKREGIAKPIVEAYPDATWRGFPRIISQDEKFMNIWNELVTSKRIYNYMQRIDIAAGIGQYGVLFMGMKSSGPGRPASLKNPVTKASELTHMAVFTQENAQIDKYVTNVNNPNYGLPELYSLQFSVEKSMTGQDSSAQATKPMQVHADRCIHVAEGILENEVFGTSRLEPVFNYVKNIEKIGGGSGEMYWRGAFPGIIFNIEDPNIELSDDTKTAMKNEMDEYLHELKRYMRLQGVKPIELKPQLAEPTSYADLQFNLISATTRIPKRILLGVESGELSSTQDEGNWNTRVDERRFDFAEPYIMRPFIDKLIAVGILPPSKYTIVWPALGSVREEDKAKVAISKTRALAEYMRGEVYLIMPFDLYLKEVFEWSKERIEQLEKEYPQLFEDLKDIAKLKQRFEEAKQGIDEGEEKKTGVTEEFAPQTEGSQVPREEKKDA